MKTKENMEIEKDIIEIVKEIRNKSKNFYNGDIVIPIMNYLIPKIDEMVDKSNKEHTKTVLEWLFPVLKLNKGSVFPVSEDILRDTQWKAKELYNELSSPEKKEEVEGWRSDAELRNDIVKAKLEIEKEEPTQEFKK